MNNHGIKKYLMTKGFTENPDFEAELSWFPNETHLENSFGLLVSVDFALDEHCEVIIITFSGDSGTGKVFVNISKEVRFISSQIIPKKLDAILEFAKDLANIVFPEFPNSPGVFSGPIKIRP